MSAPYLCAIPYKSLQHRESLVTYLIAHVLMKYQQRAAACYAMQLLLHLLLQFIWIESRKVQYFVMTVLTHCFEKLRCGWS